MDYSFNSRVRYSETGEDGRLTLPGVLNYFQDCSTFHAESIGLGGNVLKNRDRAWVLSSWQVVVEEYPVLGTEIRIRTAPYAFKGFMGMRNFVMETTDGKKLAWANTNWTYLTISTGIPTRLTPADTDSYVLSEKLEMDYAPRKIKLPEDMISQEAFVVQKHHLDTNHHVNNAQYIDKNQGNWLYNSGAISQTPSLLSMWQGPVDGDKPAIDVYTNSLYRLESANLISSNATDED